MRLIFAAFATCLCWGSLAQGIQTEFGKNRIQYHDDFDDWNRYESLNFITYWYGKGRNIGQYVVQIAEYDFKEIQNILEHKINEKIEIIVYVDVTDLKQSNLGSESAFISSTGKTKILGNKVFVYFNGNHKDLRKQIREGIATVYLDAMLHGSNLQEIVQNAVLLKVPEWFRQGVISFIGEYWSIETDDRLRDIFLHRNYRSFNAMAREFPEEAGHMLWYYIGQNYGLASIANLLYLTRINRNVNSAFLYVLSTPFKEVMRDAFVDFRELYLNESKPSSASLDLLPFNNKYNLPITHLRLNPQGNTLAFVRNELGRFFIHLYDLRTGKNQVLFKGGFKNAIQETDYNYPHIAWSPAGDKLGVIYEYRDEVIFAEFDLNTNLYEETYLNPTLHRIYSADYWDDENLIISATSDGFSNLFMYDTRRNTSTTLLDDIYDDLDGRVVTYAGEKGLLFVSNRPDIRLPKPSALDTVMPMDNYDVFFLDVEDSRLMRLTHTPYADERYPVAYSESQIAFLSDESGIRNRILVTPNPGDPRNYQLIGISNMPHNILRHEGPSEGTFFNVIRNACQIEIFRSPATDPEAPIITKYQNQKLRSVGFTLPWRDLRPVELTPVAREYEPDDKYKFQSEFPDPPKVETSLLRQISEVNINEKIFRSNIPEPEKDPVIEFNSARIVASRLQFKLDNFTSQLDNNLLFGGLDSYAGTKQGFEYPPMGILLKADIKDLFEDYGFEGGVRIPTTFNGTEYFLIFDDKKKRIDKRYAVYRKSLLNSEETDVGEFEHTRSLTSIALGEVRYPLDLYTSLRATVTLRFDKQIKLATNESTLNEVNLDEQRIGLKLEYVFDNTVDIDFNIRWGARYKAYVEFVNKMELKAFDDWRFRLGNGFMTVLGFDARYYHRLDRNSIVAIRGAGATSFGSERILYFLGGVDNWLFPTYNQGIPTPGGEDFAYNTLAANMRGFEQNIRNGSSYFLINTELRVPFMKYLRQKPMHSTFWRNLMAVGFVDVGTAWTGPSPFSKDNPLNVLTVSNPLVKVRLNYARDPIVVGYGVGLRAYLFGYLLRLDYAWGFETGQVNEPILHFSMGADF